MKHHRLSHLFIELLKTVKHDDLTLSHLLEILGEKSHSVIILIFSLPFFLPIPLPGVSIIFGLIIALTAFFQLLNKNIYLPKFISEKKIPSEFSKLIFSKSKELLVKFERFIRPRFLFISHHFMFNILADICIIFSGLFLFLPLPPGTNFPPALICALLSLGKLENDGLLMLLGLILFFSLSVVLFWISKETVHFLPKLEVWKYIQ